MQLRRNGFECELIWNAFGFVRNYVIENELKKMKNGWEKKEKKNEARKLITRFRTEETGRWTYDVFSYKISYMIIINLRNNGGLVWQ